MHNSIDHESIKRSDLCRRRPTPPPLSLAAAGDKAKPARLTAAAGLHILAQRVAARAFYTQSKGSPAAADRRPWTPGACDGDENHDGGPVFFGDLSDRYVHKGGTTYGSGDSMRLSPSSSRGVGGIYIV